MVYLCIVAFGLHYVPGFFNILAVSAIRCSPLFIPFLIYLIFETAIAVLIIYCMNDLYISENNNTQGSRTAIKYTILAHLCCIALVLIPANMNVCLLFDPKVPNILFLWIVNKFFAVSMEAEIIFRGFLQRNIQKASLSYVTKNWLLAIIITSLIFGIAHRKEERNIPTYILLADIASFFHGYTYYKTGKILCALVVYFGNEQVGSICNTFNVLLRSSYEEISL